MFGKSAKKKTYRCNTINSTLRPSDRQERIKGWDQDALRAAAINIVGCGGLGTHLAQNLARQGAGHLIACDPDEVAPENLATQLFTKRDLWKPKAHAMGRSLSRQAVLGTTISAYQCMFHELDEDVLDVDIVVGCVDNKRPSTRLDICRFCHERSIPAVILGVSTDATDGYVMVQEPGKACWACAMKPDLQQSDRSNAVSCPVVPATICPLGTLTGIATYAIDSLLMPGLGRNWNYWYISLNRGAVLGGASLVEPRPGCPVCQSG